MKKVSKGLQPVKLSEEKSPGHPDRRVIEGGDKTKVGLALTIERVMQENADANHQPYFEPLSCGLPSVALVQRGGVLQNFWMPWATW